MSKRRAAGDIVYKRPNAGFIGQPGWAYIPSDSDNSAPCLGLNGCVDPECAEWTDLKGLPGETREKAVAALKAGTFLGLACHVAECEMRDGPHEPLAA